MVTGILEYVLIEYWGSMFNAGDDSENVEAFSIFLKTPSHGEIIDRRLTVCL